MTLRIDVSTEGVFVLASSHALKSAFATSAFDYRFPEGLEQLVKDASIVAMTTSDSDEVSVEVRVGEDFPEGDFDAMVNQHLVLHDDDELLILGHAAFTAICDNHGGDHTQYRVPVGTMTGIPAGTFKANVNVTNTYDPEDPDMLAGYAFLIVLMEVEEIRWPNEVADLSS